MKTAIAGLAIALVAAGTGASHADPGDIEGCLSITNPGNPPPFSCSYVAKYEGMYAMQGTWTLTIKRGCDKKGIKCKKVIKINSSASPGGVAYGETGVIQPGDRVTGTADAMGTSIVFGNATGS